MKKIFHWILTLIIATILMVTMASAAYKDVPASSSLAGEVHKATEYGLMNGYNANTFGYSDSMTRAQFTAVLVRMMGWDLVIPDAATYADVPVGHTWLDEIETAAAHDVTGTQINFRPQEPITRGEMAELLVRALGLKSAAESLNSSQVPFSDAYSNLHGQVPFTDLEYGNEGYITVAYAIGMTNGTSATTFSPERTATRGQAAAMLVRIYEKLHQGTDEVHGFYAFSSYSQLDLADEMDSVSAGWSRMTWDGETALLSTTGANNNEYYVPSGYSEVTDRLAGNLHLSVFMDGDSAKSLLASEDGRSQAVEQIIHELTVDYRAIGENPYTGVTIDFEGLRSAQKNDFVAFLSELKQELVKTDKALYVCVSPVLSTGYYDASYYDGYDYVAIGELADKVILMAYDYETRDMSQFVGTDYHYYKTAATTPINEVYLGLKAITDEMDASKVLLGFSSRSVGWQIDVAGKLVSGTPVYPNTDTVAKRLAQTDTRTGWSDEYQQPYAIYTTEDGSRYFLWYQDDASVQTSLNAARLLGVTGVSIWRLGNIPNGDWNWNSLLDYETPLTSKKTAGATKFQTEDFSIIVEPRDWIEKRFDFGIYSWKNQGDGKSFLEIGHMSEKLGTKKMAELTAKNNGTTIDGELDIPDGSAYEYAVSMQKNNGYLLELYFTPNMDDETYYLVACCYDPTDELLKKSCHTSVFSFELK